MYEGMPILFATVGLAAENSDFLLTASCFAWLGTAMVGSGPVLDAAMPHNWVPTVGTLLLFASLALMVPLFGRGTWRRYRRVTED